MHAFITSAFNDLGWCKPNAFVDDFHACITTPHRNLLSTI
jgi:hypothetical protein